MLTAPPAENSIIEAAEILASEMSFQVNDLNEIAAASKINDRTYLDQ